MLRKALALAAGLLMAAAPVTQAFAQNYPSRPVHVVIAYNPGGTTDPIGRLFADVLRDGMKATVVPENRGGAGGSIGTALVKRSAPDGYTLLVHTNSYTLQPATVAAPVYDPNKDLIPIAMLTSAPVMMVVPKNSPYKDLNELVKAAKERPGKLNLAHGGIGTYGWYVMAKFMLDAGFRMTDVPYASAAAVQQAVLRGEVDLAIDSPVGVGRFVQEGSMRAMAVSSDERSWQAPDVPTGKELGQPFQGVAWVGLFAPVGTDPKIVQRLFDEVKAGTARPEVKERIRRLGMDLTLQEPATFARTVAEEFAATKQIIATQKIPLQ